MLNIIGKHFSEGVVASCRFDLLIRLIIYNAKLRNLVSKLCWYNFLLYVVSDMTLDVCGLTTMLTYFGYAIGIIGSIFHSLHFMDLINIHCTAASTSSHRLSHLESITVGLTMMVYQIAIYLTAGLIRMAFQRDLVWVGYD